jgi:hypothetical protein
VAQAKVVFVRESGERWRIELRSLKDFREAIGLDTLNAFCRCFVHADRLVSLATSLNKSLASHGEDSPTYERDLDTVVWLSIGCLRELSFAIRNLRSALAQRGLLDPDAPPWRTLRQIEARWDGDAFFRKVRDVAAFHVDSKVIQCGLLVLEAKGTVTLGQGDGPKMGHFTARLGRDALIVGLGMENGELERLIRQLASDHHNVADAVNEAFVLAIEKANIPQIRE